MDWGHGLRLGTSEGGLISMGDLESVVRGSTWGELNGLITGVASLHTSRLEGVHCYAAFLQSFRDKVKSSLMSKGVGKKTSKQENTFSPAIQGGSMRVSRSRSFGKPDRIDQ